MRRRCLNGVAVMALVSVAACVTRVPVVATPSYPEYLFPAVPVEYAASSEARRQQDAWTFLQAGDLMSARTRFAALLDSSPAFYPAETALGWVSVARGDYQSAVGYFDRVTTEHPRYVPALVGRGEAMLALDESEEALRSFEAALAEDAGLGGVQRIVQELRFTVVSEQLQVARRAAAASRYADARAAYARVIAASPDSAFLQIELGRVELEQGNAEAALDRARRAARLDAMDPAAFLLEGAAHEALEDLPAAIVAYERADRLEPTEESTDRLARLNERVRLAILPPEVQAISDKSTVTRGEVAALVGVRFPNLLRDWAGGRPVIMTDTRGHWGSQWIQSVAQAGIMTIDAGYRFEPSRTVRRSELAEVVAGMLALLAEIDPEAAARWEEARPRFSDMPRGHLSYPSAAQAVAAGILDLFDDETFQPTRAVDGAEAVDAVDRLAQLARDFQ